jgi:hypothetical protein
MKRRKMVIGRTIWTTLLAAATIFIPYYGGIFSYKQTTGGLPDATIFGLWLIGCLTISSLIIIILFVCLAVKTIFDID